MNHFDKMTERIKFNIHKNRDIILDNESSYIKSITLSKIDRQNFYSSRMGGKCIINYLDNSKNLKSKTIWIKSVEEPKRFFNVLSSIYKQSGNSGIHHNITTPYWYDSELGIVAMEYFKGTSVLWHTILNTLFLKKRVPHELSNLYKNIGKWLQQYHKAMVSKNHVTLHDLLNRLNCSIEIQDLFSIQEKDRLSGYLDIIRNSLPDINFALVKTHNDFTIRNIFISNSNFGIIDWDSAIHPEFPEHSSVWNEISIFLINIQSLFRFYPIIPKKYINKIIDSFKEGYFKGNTLTEYKYFPELFYVFSMRFFLGIECNKPLHQLYYKNLQPRYIKLLRKSLLNGSSEVV